MNNQNKYPKRPVKMVVMIQDITNVVHCGGSVIYDAVEIELAEEQSKKLALESGLCDYGPVAFTFDKKEAPDAESK